MFCLATAAGAMMRRSILPEKAEGKWLAGSALCR
jgi:hypothetical protein